MIECRVQFISTHDSSEQGCIHRALRNLRPGLLVTYVVMGVSYSPGSIFCRVRGLHPWNGSEMMQQILNCLIEHGADKAVYIGVTDEEGVHPPIRLTSQLAA